MKLYLGSTLQHLQGIKVLYNKRKTKESLKLAKLKTSIKDSIQLQKTISNKLHTRRIQLKYHVWKKIKYHWLLIHFRQSMCRVHYSWASLISMKRFEMNWQQHYGLVLVCVAELRHQLFYQLVRRRKNCFLNRTCLCWYRPLKKLRHALFYFFCCQEHSVIKKNLFSFFSATKHSKPAEAFFPCESGDRENSAWGKQRIEAVFKTQQPPPNPPSTPRSWCSWC